MSRLSRGFPTLSPIMKLLPLESAIFVAFSFAMVVHCPAQVQKRSGSEMSEKALPDPKIAAALHQISAARIQANIEKLVSFGTRSTLSAQDPASLAAGRGIGAAREWIKAEFERYSKDCGGCLEVKTDSFTEPPTAR